MQVINLIKKLVIFSIALLVVLVMFISYRHLRHINLPDAASTLSSVVHLGADLKVNEIINKFQTLKQFQEYTYSRLTLDNQSGSKQTEDNSDTYIEDILITIKSTKEFHESKLKYLLDTWIPQARQTTYILTDAADSKYSQLLGADKFINTGCKASHDRRDLACKFQAMYDLSISNIKRYKWFCAGDDDTYIVIPNLVNTLRQYDYNQTWYIGKNSLPHRLERVAHGKVAFWFATGGALVCFSRAMIQSMLPLCGSGGFIKRAEEVTEPDDTAIGYVCNHLLGVNLTVIPEFHSHLEAMFLLNPADYHKQVTVSYSAVTGRYPNTLLIRDEIEKFTREQDPTRLFSLHCYLYPKSDECRKFKAQLEKPSVPPSQNGVKVA